MLQRFNITVDYTFTGAPFDARRIRVGRQAAEADVVRRLVADGFTQFSCVDGVVTRHKFDASPDEQVTFFVVAPHDDLQVLYVQGKAGVELAKMVRANRTQDVIEALQELGQGDLLDHDGLGLGSRPAERYLAAV